MTKTTTQKLKKIAENVLYPLLAVGLILAIWAIVAKVKNKPLILPMPDKPITQFFELFSTREFWVSIGGSLWRTLACFSLAFVSAFIFATVGGVFKPFAHTMSPIVSILRSVPTMAVILIAMIWIDADGAPILIGFLVAFPLLYQSIYTSITTVDKSLVEMTKVYKVGIADRVRYLYLPSIAPSLFDVSRSSISLTLKVVIAAEVLAYTKKSIGFSMQSANLTFDVSLLLAWTLTAVVLSFLLEGAVALLKKLWEARK